eukprot:Hpha_TRINITY_DN16374_c3_g2::TRINITY_DN16374_c3_g2_i1::g.61958::m.61958/K04739/PRKAR; cAMP-dependent protein kinase regulator
MALAGLYRRRCEELKLKPNANLLAALPSEGSELVKLDLSDNLVGGAGLKALLEVIRHAPNLQHLRLKANNLTSPAAKDLAETLKSSSKLSLLDVRSNDIRLAGAELLDLVKANRRIEEMLLEDTFIRPFFSRRISAQLQKNLASAEQRKQSQGCLKDSSRPSTAEKKQVGFGEVVVSQPQPVKSPATTASPKSATGEGPNAEVIPAELRRYSAFEAADEDSPSPAASPAFGDFKSGFKAEPQITEEQEGLMKKLDSFSFAQGSPTKPGGASESGPGPSLGEGLKKVAARRPTVCAEAYTRQQLDDFRPQYVEKDKKDRDFLLMVLERNPMFNHLDDRELMVAVDAMDAASRTKDDHIYNQGDDSWDLFFVVKSGEVSINMNTESGVELLKTVKKGDWFGELALLYPQAAPEFAKAERDIELFSLDRMTYKFILSQASQNRRQLYGGFLRQVPFLQSLGEAEVLQLADALKSSSYDDNVPLIRFGEQGDWFHIVVEGTVAVIGRDEQKKKIKVCEFNKGDCVGELEFINHHETVADVIAVGTVRTAKMNRRHFEMCMGPVVELLRKNAASLEKFAYYRETLSKLEK